MKICWAIVISLIITEKWFNCYLICFDPVSVFLASRDVQVNLLLQNKSC